MIDLLYFQPNNETNEVENENPSFRLQVDVSSDLEAELSIKVLLPSTFMIYQLLSMIPLLQEFFIDKCCIGTLLHRGCFNH